MIDCGDLLKFAVPIKTEQLEPKQAVLFAITDTDLDIVLGVELVEEIIQRFLSRFRLGQLDCLLKVGIWISFCNCFFFFLHLSVSVFIVKGVLDLLLLLLLLLHRIEERILVNGV